MNKSKFNIKGEIPMKKLSIILFFIIPAFTSCISCQWNFLGDDKNKTNSNSNNNESAELKGWELNESNTGLKGDYSKLTELDINGADEALGYLPAWGTLTIYANKTIENKIIRDELDLSAGGITLRKCLIKPASVGTGMSVVHGSDFILENCEIDGSLLSDTSHTAISITTGSCYRSNIHGISTGIYIAKTGSATSYFVNNYIHDLSYTEGSGAHMDGITVRQNDGKGELIIKNNRVICGNADHSTGAFFSQTSAGSIDYVTISNNLFEGYGYCFYLDNNGDNGSYGSNIVIDNNRMNAYSGAAGPVIVEITGAVFTDNYRYDPDADDCKGTIIKL